jgi:IS5 family transposase
MIEMRRAQLSFGDGLITEDVSDLREDWMAYADRVLADDDIVTTVYDALAKRHPKSRSRGRLGTPAEVVLRLLVLKHIRNLSYAALEREVRDQPRVPRLHPSGQREDARCQDYGAMGVGDRAAGAQADP